MRTKCVVMTYNLNKTPLPTIESEVEKYCNDSFFTEQSVASCSTAFKNDNTGTFVVTVVYEHKVKWIKLLIFMILFIAIIMFLWLLVK